MKVDLEKDRKSLGVFLVAVYGFMILVQALCFGVFAEILSLVSVESVVAYAVLGVIILLEVLAIPFFVGFKRDGILKKVSMICGLLAVIVLLAFTIFLNVVGKDKGVVIYMFDGSVSLPVGSWMILIATLLTCVVGLYSVLSVAVDKSKKASDRKSKKAKTGK